MNLTFVCSRIEIEICQMLLARCSSFVPVSLCWETLFTDFSVTVAATRFRFSVMSELLKKTVLSLLLVRLYSYIYAL